MYIHRCICIVDAEWFVFVCVFTSEEERSLEKRAQAHCRGEEVAGESRVPPLVTFIPPAILWQTANRGMGGVGWGRE